MKKLERKALESLIKEHDKIKSIEAVIDQYEKDENIKTEDAFDRIRDIVEDKEENEVKADLKRKYD